MLSFSRGRVKARAKNARRLDAVVPGAMHTRGRLTHLHVFIVFLSSRLVICSHHCPLFGSLIAYTCCCSGMSKYDYELLISNMLRSAPLFLTYANM
jgi:hypothetical protein